jgi:hypothetical protein
MAVVISENAFKGLPDFGSSSRCARESILSICDFWRNAEEGPKEKSAVADALIYFRSRVKPHQNGTVF